MWAVSGAKYHQIKAFYYRPIITPSSWIVDTLKVFHTRWTIESLVDEVSVLHSTPAQKSNW